MTGNVYERIKELERRVHELERRPPPNRTTLDRVIDAVSTVTDVSRTELMSDSRQRHITEARRICWTLLRKRNWTLTRTGRAFHRNHASVIHALRKAAPAELLARAERLLDAGG